MRKMASSVTPMIASSLFDFEIHRQEVPSNSRTRMIGVRDLDESLPPRLWTGGKVVGVLSNEGSSVSSSSIFG